jgi:Protein of unknown function (DUF3152)
MVGARRSWLVWPVVPVLLALTANVTGCDRHPDEASAAAPPPGPVAAPSSGSGSGPAGNRAVQPALTAPPDAAGAGDITYPRSGTRQWRIAAGTSPVSGRGGTLLRFRVAVEGGIQGVDPDAFASDVVATLSEPRGWTAGGQWRLQQVGPGSPHEFTIYLATPTTRDLLCGHATTGYTSCRNGNHVVLNVARWAHGAPNYGEPLPVYRQYMVNHETGHRLGHGHELCPGPGRPAPVMQQQTLGLHGCTANPWPYLGGTRHSGPSGAYDDPVPTDP